MLPPHSGRLVLAFAPRLVLQLTREGNQSQGTVEHIPGVGTNHRGPERIFQGVPLRGGGGQGGGELVHHLRHELRGTHPPAGH
eukprot:8818105-Pyramimonas_sp.AAC.2